MAGGGYLVSILGELTGSDSLDFTLSLLPEKQPAAFCPLLLAVSSRQLWNRALSETVLPNGNIFKPMGGSTCWSLSLPLWHLSLVSMVEGKFFKALPPVESAISFSREVKVR